jgi:hypothetical protein
MKGETSCGLASVARADAEALFILRAVQAAKRESGGVKRFSHPRLISGRYFGKSGPLRR